MSVLLFFYIRLKIFEAADIKFPESAFVYKAKILIMVLNHFILGSGDKFTDELCESVRLCSFSDIVQNKVFHRALQNAAAHYPGVDKQCLVSLLQNN